MGELPLGPRYLHNAPTGVRLNLPSGAKGMIWGAPLVEEQWGPGSSLLCLVGLSWPSAMGRNPPRRASWRIHTWPSLAWRTQVNLQRSSHWLKETQQMGKAGLEGPRPCTLFAPRQRDLLEASPHTSGWSVLREKVVPLFASRRGEYKKHEEVWPDSRAAMEELAPVMAMS